MELSPFSAASPKDNVLANSVTRLPLGGTAEGSPQVVWVPTNKGGVLTVNCTSDGTVQIFEDGKPVGGKPDKQVTLTVPPGPPKARIIQATGSSPSVSCTFKQEVYARQGPSAKKDEVLIPYTFWFWPTVRGRTPFPERAIDVLQRYAKAIGKASQAGATGDWEHDEHGLATGAPWAGHCHFAAPASALFELPTDTTIGGQQFSLDEMKFLGTEFFGNFGAWTQVFELQPPYPASAKFWLRPRLLHELECFKPGGPYTVDEAARVLMMLDPGSFTDVQLATAFAFNLFGQKDPASLQASLTAKFGAKAVEFFDVLMSQLFIAKQPLFGDMRTTDPNGGPEQVWNQAIFYYSADFTENPTTGDKQDIIVSLDIGANLDREFNPNDSLARRAADVPASASSNKMFGAIDTGRANIYRHVYRLQFTAAGDLDAQNPANEWRSCIGGNGSVYAPTRLAILNKCLTSPRTSPNSTDLGTPIVGMELLSKMRINRRFR